MSTVDEILASGRYTDRRGRVWILRDFGGGCQEWSHSTVYPFRGGVPHDEFHRVIHRDECPGVGECNEHPVPNIVSCVGHYCVYAEDRRHLGRYETLHEAMNAARALAVGE